MDGQGNVNNQALKNTLSLTNIVILNFSFYDFEEV
jgi:hypothetical protein